MSFDYNKLRGLIKEKFKTESVFADRLGISRTSLSKKLNNQVQFKPNEIKDASGLLGIKESKLSEYFFVKNVRKYEHKQAS